MLSLQSQHLLPIEAGSKHSGLEHLLVVQTPKLGQTVVGRRADGHGTETGRTQVGTKAVTVSIGEKSFEIVLPAEPVRCEWLLAQVQSINPSSRSGANASRRVSPTKGMLNDVRLWQCAQETTMKLWIIT